MMAGEDARVPRVGCKDTTIFRNTGAAGIGSGYNGSCADIIISIEGVTITATKGDDAPYSIGKGAGDDATCSYVVFGINVYDPIETSPFTYTGGDYDGSGNGGTYIVVDP